MTNRDYMKEAREEVVSFAMSDQQQPSLKMVAAVNALFRDIFPNEGQKSVENAVAWRTIEVQRLVIDLIRDLSYNELTKAEKALKSIAGTFATVRCVGGDWRAYVARDGRTADRVIDEHTAKDFKLGRLSMGELINRIYPDGIPLQMEEQKEHRIKGWRR